MWGYPDEVDERNRAHVVVTSGFSSMGFSALRNGLYWGVLT